MFERMTIQSHRGPYAVSFLKDALSTMVAKEPGRFHLILDANVARLYESELAPIQQMAISTLIIEATEQAKSLEAFPNYVDHLVAHSIRRSHNLLAIGGGIIQDITCFIALTILRGVPWTFIPTTLLAQADSCIGSKSSINSGTAKNILGSFLPPREILIDPAFLKTLEPVDVLSGVGEIIKIHVIDGPASFERLRDDYAKIFTDRSVLLAYVRRALEIKKKIIEVDEFDQGIRNVMNYGHSFGHAIEAATKFVIPHGIAVTIGMDMANFVSARLGFCKPQVFENMHDLMFRNYEPHRSTPVPRESFLAAISKDKKNQDGALGLILPGEKAIPEKKMVPNDEIFQAACDAYLARGRSRTPLAAD